MQKLSEECGWAFQVRPSRRIWRWCAITAILACASAIQIPGVLSTSAENVAKPRRLNPAAWGDDHVGKPLPAYVTGDECLFCHRTIGPNWGEDAHGQTIRLADPENPAMEALAKLEGGDELAAKTRYLLGDERSVRFLRKAKDYGTLELLSAVYIPSDRKCQGESPHWDDKTFANRCAGCHATAVDAKTKAFWAVSLDCFACHGDVPLAHTKDVGKVFLSSKNRQPREVISTCGQCHLRGGKSRSTGLPYPNTFVAGDNLFRDFQVDLSDEAIRDLPLMEQHVYLNTRDVAVYGKDAVTCLSCHNVHGQSSEKHQQLDHETICATCHQPDSDNTALRDGLKPSELRRAHSRICDY